MLVPRFTIRWLLVLMTVSAVFFFIVTFAVRGEAWALGISIALASVGLTAACYAAVFLAAYTLGAIFGLLTPQPAGNTPFASEAPPPQVIPHEEPVE